ncbi:Permease MlaE [Tepidimonas alkaliphilus]|uniref:Permease MlaE n=1 Tax=Tepidimonas alkaliphilus TaxID=2588942 RepID=A0A554WA41_9BURK|nr:ABC transporter permease [Tepidimonas alkaliphilus]TSE20434.1 Permease MlaE [Tepidimonas alkaliphilus]
MSVMPAPTPSWTASVQGWRLWVALLRLMGRLLALALQPASYRGAAWPRVAQHLVTAALPALWWYAVLSALFGQVVIRIVVVTAQGYGLTQYAVEAVVRVLVLELLPLAAALFVLLRVMLARGAELRRLRREGRLPLELRDGLEPWRLHVLPRALGGAFAVVLLTMVSCILACVLTYLNLYGFSPWAWPSYTRAVGQIFNPAVTLIFSLKTLGFALAVGVVPLAAMFDGRSHSDVRALVRTAAVLLAVELLGLVGNYY